ncbi:hypothetical protein HYH03_005967 [Edaphochlamys debaryana]|uniref:Uncharacterized protein n=1 Tax=Edaphochlamys debaryana TaxID=47281 RepID=A0A836C1N2_9CHLO|nr:hypothetical protein HYH03_005967 [Edaphochlamys debaryana]|eukprot:KAG2496047.1 hypothetical protein HYH03_005967 [Edaphochlamys debaryana]
MADSPSKPQPAHPRRAHAERLPSGSLSPSASLTGSLSPRHMLGTDQSAWARLAVVVALLGLLALSYHQVAGLPAAWASQATGTTAASQKVQAQAQAQTLATKLSQTQAGSHSQGSGQAQTLAGFTASHRPKHHRHHRAAASSQQHQQPSHVHAHSGAATADGSGAARTPAAIAATARGAVSAPDPDGPALYTMTFAAGYKPSDVCVLVASWRRFEPSSKLVLFVNDEDVGAFEEAHPGVVVLGTEEPTFPGPYAICKHRFLVLAQYLKEHWRDMDGVLFIDARDAAFNAPFWTSPWVSSTLRADAVAVVLEGGIGDDGEPRLLPIKGEKYNRKWVQDCHGKAGLERVGSLPVFNAGSAYGTAAAMYNFSLLITELLVQTFPAPLCNDQGLLNWMIHALAPDGLPFKHEVQAPGQGPIYTAAYGLPVEVDESGVAHVFRSDPVSGARTASYTPALLHQYDRDELLENAIRAANGCPPALPAAVRRCQRRWYCRLWTRLIGRPAGSRRRLGEQLG